MVRRRWLEPMVAADQRRDGTRSPPPVTERAGAVLRVPDAVPALAARAHLNRLMSVE